MNAILGSTSAWDRAVISFALATAVRASIMILIAFAIHWVLRRRSVLIRSVVWNTTLVGLLVLPVAVLVLPRIGLVLPVERSKPVRPEPGIVVPAATTLERSLPPRAVKNSVSRAIVTASIPGKAPRPVETRAPRVPWVKVFTIIYGLVAIGLFARLGISLLAVRRLRHSCSDMIDTPWLEVLNGWRDKLEIGSRVRLGRSSMLGSPVVIGWWRPIIVLPEKLVDSASRSTMDAVIIHELAHVQRGDYAWNLMRRVVQAVYWPHPLSWPLGAVVASVREQACDDLCVHWMGGADDYRATLLTVAENLVRRPGTALGMAMTRSTRLRRRLLHIAMSSGRARCLLQRPARALIALTAIVTVALLGSIQVARSAIAQTDAKAESSESASKSSESKAKSSSASASQSSAKNRQKSKAPAGAEGGPDSETIQAMVAKPQIQEWPTSVSQITSLEAIESAPVLPPKGKGRLLARSLAEPGDRVKKGQVLGIFEDAQTPAEIAAARAKSRRAESHWKQTQAELRVAQLVLEEKREGAKKSEALRLEAESKLQTLEKQYQELAKSIKDTGNDTSNRRLELIEGRLKTAEQVVATATSEDRSATIAKKKAEAGVELAEASEQSAKVSWDEAEDQLQRLPAPEKGAGGAETAMLSPLDGIVLRRLVNPGFVAGTQPGFPEGAVFEVAHTDSLIAEVSISESEALLIEPDNQVEFRLSSRPDKIIKAKIHRIGAVVENGELLVHVEIPNSDGKLRPGMRGAVTIVLGLPHRALTIPLSATRVVRPNVGYPRGCFQVVNGRAEFVPLQLGQISNGRIEVLEGLKEDDSIIIYQVEDGRVVSRRPPGVKGSGIGIVGGERVEVVNVAQPPMDDRWDFQDLPKHEQSNDGMIRGFGGGFR